MMLRVFLFLATNFAILLLLSIVFTVFGIGGILDEHGVGLDLVALLISSAVIGFTGSLFSLLISRSIAKRMMRVRMVTTPANDTERWLLEVVQKQSDYCGIAMPEFGIFDAAEPNAFATGPSKNRSLIAVSSGLLQQMERDEIEAVLGHEMAHVANGDMVTMALLQGIVNTFVVFLARVIGFVVDRFVFRTERGLGPGYFIVSIVMQIVLSILATMLVMWFSRYREFRADAGGAHLAGREKMIRALQRLRAVSRPHDLPDSVASFGISGAKAPSRLRQLFSSHPPLERRIASLEAQEYKA